MPTTDSSIQWYIATKWRDTFSVRGWDYPNSGCDTAYMEIYYASQDGAPVGSPVQGPLCGEVAPSDFTSPNQVSLAC